MSAFEPRPRAPRDAKASGRSTDALMERHAALQTVRLSKERRNDALARLTAAAASLDASPVQPAAAPPVTVPHCTFHPDGRLKSYSGGPRDAFALVRSAASPTHVRCGLASLRRHYNQLILGLNALTAIPPPDLFEALFAERTFSTFPAEVLTLVATVVQKELVFAVKLEPHLPAIVALATNPGRPPAESALALTTLAHVATRQVFMPILRVADPIFRLVRVAPPPPAVVLTEAANLVRALCESGDIIREIHSDSMEAYEAFVPTLFDTAHRLLASALPAVKGAAICAMARLATSNTYGESGRVEVCDRLVAPDILAHFASALDTTETVGDVLKAFGALSNSTHVAHVAPLTAHLPRMWAIANASSGTTRTLIVNILYNVALTGPELSSAVFLTLFPSQAVSLVAIGTLSAMGAPGAALLALVHCNEPLERQTALPILGALAAGLKDVGGTFPHRRRCMIRFNKLLERDARAWSTNPAAFPEDRATLGALDLSEWCDRFLAADEATGPHPDLFEVVARTTHLLRATRRYWGGDE